MLNGIVLAGGASSRFGSSKSKMQFNNKSVLDESKKLLDKFCEKVLVSCREEQNIEAYECLYDLYTTFAPISGIYTALMHFKSPVIVLSCDLAFIDEATINELIKERNIAKENNKDLYMTCFEVYSKKKNQGKSLEPLVGIYEYEACALLKEALDKELYSLYRTIPNEHRRAIFTENNKPFFNINTLEDKEEAESML